MGPIGCPKTSLRYYHSAMRVMSQQGADLKSGRLITRNAAAAAAAADDDDDGDDDRRTSRYKDESNTKCHGRAY